MSVSPFLVFLFAGSFVASGQQLVIPSGTPLEARLTQHVPMKKGQRLETVLVYPLFVDNQMALPAGTRLSGSVIALTEDRSRRIDARLNADFTPFHHPVVRFDQAELADGTKLPLTTSEASNGAPLLRLSPPARRKSSSIIAQQWQAFEQQVKAAKEAVFGPGKGDRLVQLVYHQLPYHPERIEKDTVWACELTAPVAFPATSIGQLAESGASQGSSEKPSLLLHAYLDQKLSSKEAHAGDTFRATIAEPVRDANHTLLILQGSTLTGTVTRAKPAKSFGRAGVLRFDFRQLTLPDGLQKRVTSSVAGIDSAAGSSLQLDPEGQVKPQPQDKVLVPLALTFLASRPLDSDGSQLGGATVGSNGLGLAGRIVGMASASRDLAAGIGFYGAAISVYRRWLRRGREVEFPEYNRIDVEISERTGKELLSH